MNTKLDATFLTCVIGLHVVSEGESSLELMYNDSIYSTPITPNAIEALFEIRGQSFFQEVGNPDIDCWLNIVATEEIPQKAFGFIKGKPFLNIEAFYNPQTNLYFLTDNDCWCDENRGYDTEITKISAKDEGYLLTLANGSEIFIPPEKRKEFNDSFGGTNNVIVSHLMGESAQSIEVYVAYDEYGEVELMFASGDVISI